MKPTEALLADVLSGDGPDTATLAAYARDPASLAPDVRRAVEAYLLASPAHRDRMRAISRGALLLRGSCLCGGVRYEVRGPIGPIGLCHCRDCRKSVGSAFGAFAVVPEARIRWLRGSELVARYESEPGAARSFCARCGSTLTGRPPAGAPGFASLALGTLDDAPLERPIAHAHVASKAPWYEIGDDLPRFEHGFPPPEPR